MHTPADSSPATLSRSEWIQRAAQRYVEAGHTAEDSTAAAEMLVDLQLDPDPVKAAEADMASWQD